MKKRFISILLCLCMTLTLIPMTAFAVSGSAIQLGADGIDTNDKVFFGKYGAYDVPWLVLPGTALSQTRVTGGAAVLPLLSEHVLGNSHFGNDAFLGYPYSELRGAMNSIYSGFDSREQSAVYVTWLTDFGIDASLFPLSHSEERDLTLNGADLRAGQRNAPGTNVRWWLRSSDNDGTAYCVQETGNHGIDTFGNSIGVRPAFNLDTSKVLFASAATGGKSANGMETALTEVSTKAPNEWKLTLKDDSRSGFSITTTALSGTSATVDYAGAKTGANEYISAVIVDNGSVIYYGRLLQLDGATNKASGTVDIRIPESVTLDADTALKVFNEQFGGDRSATNNTLMAHTDYASELKAVTAPVAVADNFSFTAPTDLIYSGTEKAAYVTKKEGIMGIGTVTVKYYDSNGDEVAPVNAGTYTVKIDVTATDNYKAATDLTDASWTFTIEKKALNISVADVEINKGQSMPALTVNASGFVNGESESNLTGFAKPTAAINGTVDTLNTTVTAFEVLYSGGDATTNYTFNKNTTAKIKINKVPIQESYYSANKALDEWQNENITLTPTNGYSHISADGTSWQSSLSLATVGASSSQTFYLKKSDGTVTESKTITYMLDKTNPDGDIKFNNNPVKRVLNSITFGLFFKDTVNIEITASDTGSDIASVLYIRSEMTMTEAAVRASTAWKTYTSLSETPADNGKFVYYVKLTDNAGNITYFGSRGATFDTTAPSVTGVNSEQIYYTTQSVTVSDTNIDTITLNGTSATSPITLEGNKTAAYVMKATDKAGNETTVTVTMKPISELADRLAELTQDNVKSSDKAAVEAVQDILDEMDMTNATQSEKDAINGIKKKSESLTEKISETVKEIERIKKAIAELENRTVTSDDKESLDKLTSEIDRLIETGNMTADEISVITAAKDTADEYTEQLETAEEALKSALDSIPDITDSDITLSNKINLEAAKTAIEKTLRDYGDSLTESEKAELSKRLAEINAALTQIENAKKTQGLVNSLPDADKISVNDADAVKTAKAAYDALTEREKAMVGTECKEKLNTAVKALANLGKGSNSPQTGDTSNMVLWVALLFISASTVATLGITRKHRRKAAK